MRSGIVKASLCAAFFCVLLLLTACRSRSGLEELSESACEAAHTPVAEIQGASWTSPVQGETLTVTGVVTHVDSGHGFYLEEEDSDIDEDTSNGVYVDAPMLAEANLARQRLVVRGEVAELGERRDTQTALTRVDAWRSCETGLPLPVTEARLPMGNSRREALESMHVRFSETLWVTDVYRHARGQIGVAAEGILPAPTEVAWPGEDAGERAKDNRRKSLSVCLPVADEQVFTLGAGVMSLQGTLGKNEDWPCIKSISELSSMPVGPVVNPPADNAFRAVGLNLRNYFNGDGSGGGFPTPRGARSHAEFATQRNRLREAYKVLEPDILAVMELENDGFDRSSAAADVLRDIEGVRDDAPWTVVDPRVGLIGDDQIKVGLFYNTVLFEEVSRARILDTGPFQYGNRPSLAQAFVHKPTGQRFLVVVSHFKSKGSCPEDGPNADRRDGQGCWNALRRQAAESLVSWARELAEELTDGHVLLLGDFNAYRMEDPIQTIINSGLKDLTASVGLRQEYTYVYRGEAGTLDYAFASPGLKKWVRSGRILNINAGQPDGLRLKQPYLRASDHDPVIVDLRPGSP